MIRNPRDVCLSLFKEAQILFNYTGDFDLLANIFTRDVGPGGGPFFKCVLSYWNQRSNKNILIVTFEDMKKNLPSVITQVAEFLNISPSQEEIDNLAEHLSFENMKANPMTNLETETKVTDELLLFIFFVYELLNEIWI